MRIKTDLEIARDAALKPITSIAARIGIPDKFLECYGEYKAKVSLDILKSTGSRKRAKYIDVTAITPTPLGEGKTVTTIGLSMALNRIGKKTACCLRQPSLGPVFGIKGGAAGGGRSQVIPMEDFNLHLTGDFHAVSLAHNLCAAFLDNHLFRGNRLGIDRDRIYWRRVVDVNDRSLRSIRIGLGGGENGIERDTGFDITAASELMAILALTDSMPDLRKRISRIVVALTREGRPVTCEDLKVAGAMAVLLKDAVRPTLIQTLENTPCFVHAGPFANIAHGNSSIVADKIAIRLADFVVTESGFGADCGAEKFFDIKCRQSGLKPDAAVLVCSIRALKMHSGRFSIVAGRPLDRGLIEEDLDALELGCVNLEKQIENIRLFGVPCVVAVNRFNTDTDREIDLVKKAALRHGAFGCAVSELWRYGSKGGVDLAKAVAEAADGRSRFKFLYPLDISIKEKIETIAKRVYGAGGVRYGPLAEENIALYKRLGFGGLPVCMAKTHLSLSHDPRLKGAPKGFTLPVSDVRPSVGAGFLYALCGEMRTMPSLPSHPAGEKVDIDSKGEVKGLF
jgi:formate--tetrahydrofolate ligase